MDAKDWDRRYAESGLVWSAMPNTFVVEELSQLAPGQAVDIAAGEGRNALWLAERGWQVTAVDFSQAGLEKGRAMQAAHDDPDRLSIEWVCADVTRHDLGQDSYDLALLAYLQLPDDQRFEAVRRAFLSLRVGGRLVVVAHDSTNLAEGVGGPQDPDVLYTAEDVLADLDGERFDVVRAERVSRETPSGSAYDALVHLVRTD